MKKNIILSILAVILFSLPVSAATYPEPKGYVNDFANIISDDVEKTIESQLTNYEKTTEIQLAVVTTPSLDNEDIEGWTIGLADQWKVGKKGLDNGVIIVIAPNERKWRIEVGNGLQWTLTDARAGQFGDSILPEHFRAGDYDGGIKKLVGEITQYLGTTTAKERAELKAKKVEEDRIAQEKSAAAAKVFFEVMGVIVALIILCVGLFFLIRFCIHAYHTAQQKARLREHVQGRLASNVQKSDDLIERTKKIETQAAGFPGWAKEKIEGFSKEALKIIADAAKEEDRIMAMLADDPYKANDLADAYDKTLQKAMENVAAALAVPAEIKHFQQIAPQMVADAETALKDLQSTLQKLSKDGYRFNYDSQLGDLLTNIIALQDRIEKGKTDNFAASKEIAEHAQSVMTDLKGIARSVNNVVAGKEHTDSDIGENEKLLNTADSQAKEYGGKLDSLQKENPEEVWSNLKKRYALVAGEIKEARQLLQTAKDNNSLTAQKFKEAVGVVARAAVAIESIRQCYADIEETQKTANDARMGFSGTCQTTEDIVAKALKKVKDSDVAAKAKKKAKDASEKLEETKKMSSGGGLINWIAIGLGLAAAAKLAKEAIKLAEGDLEEVASSRRRSASASSSYVSSSSSSSSSSISDGGGGFGGFGGGGFSGGGASGGW